MHVVMESISRLELESLDQDICLELVRDGIHAQLGQPQLTRSFICN